MQFQGTSSVVIFVQALARGQSSPPHVGTWPSPIDGHAGQDKVGLRPKLVILVMLILIYLPKALTGTFSLPPTNSDVSLQAKSRCGAVLAAPEPTPLVDECSPASFYWMHALIRAADPQSLSSNKYMFHSRSLVAPPLRPRLASRSPPFPALTTRALPLPLTARRTLFLF